MDHSGERTGPSWEGENVISEGCVVYLVDKEAEEGGGLIVVIWFELRVDVNDKCGGYCMQRINQPAPLSFDTTRPKSRVELTKIRVVFRSRHIS